MANIQPEINDFENAVYGEEVRRSLISLAQKLNTEVEAGSTTINQYTTAITQAIASANDAAGDANDAASAASSAANAADAARTAIEANETARATAEQARATAETARASADQVRATAEATRATAEQQRAAAETQRVAAEQARATAEANRDSAEQQRAAAEATRASAEAERVGRESARVANEDLRVAQERDRVNAETERQRAFNNMSQQVLPPTSTTTLGGMIVGDGLTNDSDGRVSVIGAGDLETATHAAATYATKDELADKANVSHTHAASEITSGTLPVTRGGTGLSASPSMLTDLGSTSADDVLKASPRPGVTGTLPVANGGTGIATTPLVLTDLGSTNADTPYKESPRPGVTGTLPIANGGTGATTAAGAAENIVDGQAIEPASVAATGEVSAKSGSTTHKLTEKAEDADLDKLESSIAYVESVTAKKNHAVGDYFMLGDVLMKATAAIATGETINASKATPATVQAQIDTLRDSVFLNKTQNLKRVGFGSSNANPIIFQTFVGDTERYVLQFTSGRHLQVMHVSADGTQSIFLDLA